MGPTPGQRKEANTLYSCLKLNLLLSDGAAHIRDAKQQHFKFALRNTDFDFTNTLFRQRYQGTLAAVQRFLFRHVT
jgi:hypothetical protein